MKRIHFAFALVLATVACATDSATDTATPTGPTAVVVTETFSGNVAVGGSNVHTFTVSLSGGQLNAILTEAGPPATIYMGLGVGTYSNGECTLLTNGSVITQSGPTAQLTGTINTAGVYCVKVYDAGNQAAEIKYSVTVNHY